MYSRHRFIQCYSRQGRVAVLVEFGLDKPRSAESPEFTELSHGIAMHIAVLNPGSTPGLLRQRYDRDPSITVEVALASVSTLVGDRNTSRGPNHYHQVSKVGRTTPTAVSYGTGTGDETEARLAMRSNNRWRGP